MPPPRRERATEEVAGVMAIEEPARARAATTKREILSNMLEEITVLEVLAFLWAKK